MNSLEKTMVATLKDLKANHSVIGVKAEFEAEGTRMEEALRLKEVVISAGLDLTIKIGGCEALKDMYDSRSIGVSRIVAPMIESAYAMTKFIEATRVAFPKDELDDIRFAINVETKSMHERLEELLANPVVKDLDSVVIGRGDLSCSFGLTREMINCPQIFAVSKDIAAKCKKAGLRIGMGGGVSGDSIEFFNKLDGLLDFYETRKVIFDAPLALKGDPGAGILKAVGFELMWLKNKRNYYGAIHQEDSTRIKHLEAHYSKLIEAAGGKH